ncbi:unnamed protein product [Orchesella dallaii]|uniref:Uncharacterized protein n=1 Tax=Orchesella dallaii TaxID=48710 RepID=A0ABP1R191_9HEXA
MSNPNGNRPATPYQPASMRHLPLFSFNQPPIQAPRSPSQPRPQQVNRNDLRQNMLSGVSGMGTGTGNRFVGLCPTCGSYRPPFNIPPESPEPEEDGALSTRAPPASPSSDSSDESLPDLETKETKETKEQNKKRDDDDEELPPTFRWVHLEIV